MLAGYVRALNVFGLTPADAGVFAAIVVPVAGGLYTFVAWWRSKGHQERNEDTDTQIAAVRELTGAAATFTALALDWVEPMHSKIDNLEEGYARMKAELSMEQIYSDGVREYIELLHEQIRGLGHVPYAPPDAVIETLNEG